MIKTTYTMYDIQKINTQYAFLIYYLFLFPSVDSQHFLLFSQWRQNLIVR